MFQWPLNLNANLRSLQNGSNHQQQPILPTPGNQNPNPNRNDLAFADESVFDEYFMYYYKMKPCRYNRRHDWTMCPFTHRGDKKKRRDPRRVPYYAIACEAHRVGICRNGDNCEFAHGLFELWLHPARYRTRLCNNGQFCYRKVCFFAHTQEELRPKIMHLRNNDISGFASRGNVGSTSSSTRQLISPVDGSRDVGSTSSTGPRFGSRGGVGGESYFNRFPELMDSFEMRRHREDGASTSGGGRNGNVIRFGNNVEEGRGSNVVVGSRLDASKLPDQFGWAPDLLDKWSIWGED